MFIGYGHIEIQRMRIAEIHSVDHRIAIFDIEVILSGIDVEIKIPHIEMENLVRARRQFSVVVRPLVGMFCQYFRRGQRQIVHPGWLETIPLISLFQRILVGT